MQFRRITLVFALFASTALAHVGSPDVYLDAKAGPYQLFVTVQPPVVIPGVAQIQVRAVSPGVKELRATPLEMTGAGAKFAPVPDRMQPSKDDPQYFTGALWLMRTGSWQVRITANGDQGAGVVSVPLPAIAQSTKKMQAGLGGGLLVMMTFLVVGLIAIFGASVREAQLDPGESPVDSQRKRGRIVMGIAAIAVVAIIWVGNNWWNDEAHAYDQYIYKPLQMAASVEQGHLLKLQITDPGWIRTRHIDDLVPDHNHLMHLYVVRTPEMNVVYHLHPELAEAGVFQLDMPTIPAGEYRLYADVVHEDGFPETLVTTVDLPAIQGRALSGDDASGTAVPVTEAKTNREFTLPNGYRMIFDHDARPISAKRPELFRFKLVDKNGAPPQDMALYMGMLGHAAFMKSDGKVFAHIHPNGSVAMAALMLADEQNQKLNGATVKPISTEPMNVAGMHHMHDMGSAALPNEVSFPYGFPTAGRYRIFVQMKHGETVETGAFDVDVQ